MTEPESLRKIPNGQSPWTMAASELRLDPLTGRWVVVSTERAVRSGAFRIGNMEIESAPRRPCPFCPGGEEPEADSYKTQDSAGRWTVRVIPNRYPVFAGDEPLVVRHNGPVFGQAPASGIHEVLVLCPDHDSHWGALDDSQIDAVMYAIRERLQSHYQAPEVRYSQVIVNAGREAGASIEHPHGQLLGMPFVPRELVDEQAGFSRFSGNCILCATVAAEEEIQQRVVQANENVLVLCPYWSGVPFEMLVMPRQHGSHFRHASPEVLSSVGRAIKHALEKLFSQLGPVPYNIVFHSSPHRSSGIYHWHVHILPKLTTLAGFELGTGVLVNIVAPELACEQLKIPIKSHT